MTRVYRLPPGATTPMVVDAARSNPNGITLSLDEMFLFVTDGQGLYRYPVNADGSTGTATRIAQNDVSRRRRHGHRLRRQPLRHVEQPVIVINPTGTGTLLGTITVNGVQSATNVAFGGANHQTLYVTGLGNGMGGARRWVSSAPTCRCPACRSDRTTAEKRRSPGRQRKAGRRGLARISHTDGRAARPGKDLLPRVQDRSGRQIAAPQRERARTPIGR